MRGDIRVTTSSTTLLSRLLQLLFTTDTEESLKTSPKQTTQHLSASNVYHLESKLLSQGQEESANWQSVPPLLKHLPAPAGSKSLIKRTTNTGKKDERRAANQKVEKQTTGAVFKGK